jgi:peptidoglycan/xylan/chitin deacetylase (PgdA/CDA1 family)
MANRLLNENSFKIIKRADEEGHVIGNHNYYHTSVLEDLQKLNNINDENRYYKEFNKYFDRSTNLFMKKLGKAPKFFRPPYGDIDYHTAELITNLTKLKIVLWNLDSEDWYHIQEGQNPEMIVENFLNKINDDPESSYISLQHDKGEDFEGDLKRLDRILDIIRINNFELVTLDKCLNEEPYFYN